MITDERLSALLGCSLHIAEANKMAIMPPVPIFADAQEVVDVLTELAQARESKKALLEHLNKPAE